MRLLVARNDSKRFQRTLVLPEIFNSRLGTEREGFEPSLELPLNSISSAAPSTTRPPLLMGSQLTIIHHQ